MTLLNKPYMPVILAFILGLGFPKTFTLLYLILLISFYLQVRHGSWLASSPVIIPLVSLFLFGISYSVIQIWHTTWMPWRFYIPEIIAVSILPALCLVVGWLIGAQRMTKSTRWFISYILGSLIYALLSLLRSHQPWWSILQPIHHVALVPWGEPQWLSIRAIEQRGFLSFAFIASIAPLVKAERVNKIIIVVHLVLGLMSLYVVYATQSGIGLLTLYLILLPTITLLSGRILKLTVLIGVVTPLLLGILSGRICDERISLVANFIREMPNALMGGRVISFNYNSCIANESPSFGNAVNTDAFSPHNVILDIYNDAGLVPCLFLFVGILMLTIWWLVGYFRMLKVEGFNNCLSCRWSIGCVLFIQWICQPFMYTDQLMFSLGFLFLGICLREYLSYTMNKLGTANNQKILG